MKPSPPSSLELSRAFLFRFGALIEVRVSGVFLGIGSKLSFDSSKFRGWQQPEMGKMMEVMLRLLEMVELLLKSSTETDSEEDEGHRLEQELKEAFKVLDKDQNGFASVAEPCHVVAK
ncbi:hypothetical protein CCACVL1_08535 [Corchorus capsularis]|uniref:EF-hand domain-containing protein n=1 Tax=Corchorus capsularis TaxID=210143 RepID=A0A1R3J069_COCAP|nr:hypothetical protein CCACVL1_08535 [Corchorus capsularis]